LVENTAAFSTKAESGKGQELFVDDYDYVYERLETVGR